MEALRDLLWKRGVDLPWNRRMQQVLETDCSLGIEMRQNDNRILNNMYSVVRFKIPMFSIRLPDQLGK